MITLMIAAGLPLAITGAVVAAVHDHAEVRRQRR